LEHEAVIMVDTMEELLDVSYLLMMFDKSPTQGTAILTDSGAFKGYALDFCEETSLPLPALSPETQKELSQILPGYTSASNPLDITAQALIEMNIYSDSARALLNDPVVGSLLVSVLPGSPKVGLMKGHALLPAIANASKPVVYVVLGEGAPLADELVTELASHRIPLFRSAERAMKALAIVTQHGRRLEKTSRLKPQGNVKIPALPHRGVLSEHIGKQYLKEAGINVPLSGLATTLEQALDRAKQIGYPVVLKAQSAQLAHKSDVGGVIVGIKNEQELEAAWERLQENIRTARPDIVLDGVLVEQMAQQGIEMVVGARRDSQWGPIVMVGLGGIWIEVLKDVRFVPPDLDPVLIVEEILKLRSAPLLRGARGAEPADVEALANVVSLVGQLMKQTPELKEIDINPLMVLPEGKGVIALDALIVAEETNK
jgi:acyl-CoA synthetase (NDP forming)